MNVASLPSGPGPLIVTPGFWIGSGGLLGWICHLIAAYTAYNRAEYKRTAAVVG